jgi:hypothetical protein
LNIRIRRQQLTVDETRKQDEALALLRELTTSTNKTIESHKAALLQHEEDLKMALQSLKNQADCIGIIRGDIERLAPLINAQSTLISALQGTMLRVITRLGMDSEAPASLSN